MVTKVIHETWGEGYIIPTTEKLDDQGEVISGDVMFEHGIEQNVPISDLAEMDYSNVDTHMVVSQTRSIATNAERLLGMIRSDHDLPEWCHTKIALAQDYVLTVADFIESESQLGAQPTSEEVEQVDEKLVGKQHKIDANHNGKIDAEDFKILKAKKKMHKEEVEEIEEGRGKGSGRGRPKKEESEAADVHPVSQLKRLMDTHGGEFITKAGKKVHVKGSEAHALHGKHDELKTSDEKLAFADVVHTDPHAALHAKGPYSKPKETRIAMGSGKMYDPKTRTMTAESTEPKVSAYVSDSRSISLEKSIKEIMEKKMNLRKKASEEKYGKDKGKDNPGY